MTSRLRNAPAGVPQHVVQRRNNKEPCFIDRDDHLSFLTRLQKYAQLYHVHIHAWALMSNHYHLLCTPQKERAVADMNRSLSQSYVPYFNKKYARTGKFWQGRYFSSPVESEKYLLQVSRYIELNPVRAGVVEQPEDYVWSSYRSNALGKPSTLLTEHVVYHELGESKQQRCMRYQSLFDDALSQKMKLLIRTQTQRNLPIGSSDFIEEIEE